MRISDWSSDVCSSDLSYSACRVSLTICSFYHRRIVAQRHAQPGCATCASSYMKYSLIMKQKLLRQTYLSWLSETSLRLSTERYSRSEEHTSELQSLMRISYAVFCLNKKIKKNNKYYRY